MCSSMEVQLIYKEADFKALFPAQNIAGEYLSVALFEAQEIDLKSIVGGILLNALKEHAREKDWAQFPAYATLRDKAQFFSLYQTIIRLIPKVATHYANAGAFRVTDDKMQPVSREEVDTEIENYKGQADFFCNELQGWLCHNSHLFPELAGCDCGEMRAQLNSVHNLCSIWLGGDRGLDLGGGGCCE